MIIGCLENKILRIICMYIVNLLKRNHIENLKECNDLKLSNNTEFICLTKYKYANTDSS